MKTQALPSSPLLRGPIDLFSGPAWDPELIKVLLRLTKDKSGEITDPRLILNGIIVQFRAGSERALLHSVANVINFMGSDDVIEIVKAIRENPSVSVEDCRPLKVKVIILSIRKVYKPKKF